jgi:hypothetical protein
MWALSHVDDGLAAHRLVVHKGAYLAYQSDTVVFNERAVTERKQLGRPLREQPIVGFEFARPRRNPAEPKMNLPVRGHDRRLRITDMTVFVRLDRAVCGA